MELKPDCVRLVLLDLEKRLKPNEYIPVYNYLNLFPVTDEISKEDIGYTIDKLYEAGYLELNDYGSINSASHYLSANILSITHEGHKFLDSIRDDTTWKNIKKKLVSAGIFTLQTITATATETIIAALNEPK